MKLKPCTMLPSATGGKRDEGEHAEQLALGVDDRPARIPPRGRRVRLDVRVVGLVLLEPRDGAVGDRRIHAGRLVQELVREDYPREAQDADRVADLGHRRVGQRQHRVVAVRHLEQGQVAARGAPASALAGGLYFFTSALEPSSARELDGDRRSDRDLDRGQHLVEELRLSDSSASGRSPGCMRAAAMAGPMQAVVTARWAIWLTSQRGIS